MLTDLTEALALSTFSISPLTSLFYAERAYCIDQTVESNAFVYASCLAKVGRHQEAIHVLRQCVTPQATPDGLNPFGSTKRWTPALRSPRPAVDLSVRCARLYATCCAQCGRVKEGRLVLAKALDASSIVLRYLEPADLDAIGSSENNYVCEQLELARLADQAGERDRASIAYRKALQAMPWCWEAFMALAVLRTPADPQTLSLPKPTELPVSPAQTARSLSTLGPSSSSSSQSALALHPAPLAPSQTVLVNGQAVLPRRMPSSNGENMSLATPTSFDARSKGLQGENARGPLAIWRKGAQNTVEVLDMQMNDSSMLENSLNPLPFAFRLDPASHANQVSAGSLFTPPNVSSATTGVKRARGASQSSTNHPQSVIESDAPTTRPVRGVPEKRGAGSTNGPTRRSSRLSAAPATAAVNSVNAFASHLQPQSASSRGTQQRTSKKRSKAERGQAVLADQSVPSPASASSSPAPSSPSMALPTQLCASPESEYVLDILRKFGKAVACESNFEHEQALQPLLGLPMDQQRSLFCLLLLGRIHMEMLQYEKAAQMFAQAHQLAPHCHESMEQYSVLLWHLRSSTAVSILAQELMATSPRSCAAWIATGNVFSLLEDHGSALKCFRRASQLDGRNIFAFTLSGHECVSMEEWDRALNFFREAIRLDPKSYSAWYGMGSTYYQSGQYRLAEYHFRKASDLNPTNAILLTLTANVLEKLGRRREALELHDKACLAAPASAAVRMKRVKVLMACKEYALAERDLQHLRNIAPNEYTVHFYLGKLYKSMGRESDMLRSFAMAQDLEPRVASAVRAIVDHSAEMEVDAR